MATLARRKVAALSVEAVAEHRVVVGRVGIGLEPAACVAVGGVVAAAVAVTAAAGAPLVVLSASYRTGVAVRVDDVLGMCSQASITRTESLQMTL